MNVDPSRIAIFRLGHIGDTVVALPALWTVRKRFPKAHIVYLTQEDRAGKLAQGTEVLRKGTVFDDLLVYKLGADGVSRAEILRTLTNLRRQKIDMVVYIPPFRSKEQLDRDATFFRLAGIQKIVGMQGYRETEYRPGGVPLPTVAHEADILLGHLARDGVSTPEDPISLMDFGFSEEERSLARSWVEAHEIDLKKPVIGFAPCSKMASKIWPGDRFGEVLRTLDAEYDPTFIAFGGPSDLSGCQTLCNGVSRSINTAGQLTVRQSAAILEYCTMHLGVDTGVMHLAAAVGTPCVAIFSARDWPGRWAPYGKGHIVHRAAVPCEGCMLEVCDRGNECMLWISSEQVMKSARTVLERERSGSRSLKLQVG